MGRQKRKGWGEESDERKLGKWKGRKMEWKGSRKGGRRV